MRFGLFWLTLKFNLSMAGDIINAACLLHNLIIEERDTYNVNPQDSDTGVFRTFSTSTINLLDRPSIPGITRTEFPNAMVSDNNEPNPGGRPTFDGAVSKADGGKLRDILSLSLSINDKKRPHQKGFITNDYGMVYM
jgi:hypothetical protein